MLRFMKKLSQLDPCTFLIWDSYVVVFYSFTATVSIENIYLRFSFGFKEMRLCFKKMKVAIVPWTITAT